MLILTWIRKIYKILSAEASPEAIAFGILFGLVLGFVPFTSGLAILLIASILVIRVQISSALAAFAIAKILSPIGLAHLSSSMGSTLLEADGLRGFWTWACNFPVLAWLDLNWPQVVGGACLGLVLGGVLFWPICKLIVGYREFVQEKASENRFFRWLTSFWLTKLLRFILLGSKVAS